MEQLKKILIMILGMCLLFMGNAFAAESNTQITLDEAGETYLDLRWEKVENAYGYYVSYGIESGIEKGYEFEVGDLVEGTKVSLKNLEGNTSYFVALAAIDENGDELSKSKEFSFITQKAKKLPLKGVKVIGENVLELSFGAIIDGSKEKDLIIKSPENNREIIINNIDTDGKNMLITVEESFISQQKYSVVIISLFGTDGSTIVSGIDGAVEFTAPDMSVFAIEDEVIEVDTTEELANGAKDGGTKDISVQIFDSMPEESITDIGVGGEEPSTGENGKEENVQIEADSSENDELEQIELHSADEGNQVNNDQVLGEGSGANLAGEDINGDEIDKNISVAAGENSNLPTTGTGHIFIVILAVILGALMFHIRKKTI